MNPTDLQSQTLPQRSTFAAIGTLFSAYPQRSIVVLISLALAGAAEAFGIATLLPVLGLVSGGERAGNETAAERLVVSALEGLGLSPTITVLLLVIVIVMILRGVLMIGATAMVGFVVAHVMTDLRLSLLRALLSAKWEHFTGQASGKFANAISSEALRAAHTFQFSFKAAIMALQVVIYLCLAFLVSWQVSVVAIFAGGFLLFALRRLVRMTREAGSQQTVLMTSLVSRLVDGLKGIKPLKAMASEDRVAPLLEAETAGLNEAQRKQVLGREGLVSVQEPIIVIFLAAGMYGAVSAEFNDMPTLIMMAFLFYRTVSRVGLTQQYWQTAQASESAFWSLREQINEAEEKCETLSGSLAPAFKREIQLSNLSFKYAGQENEPVLRDVSLNIPAGSITTIKGPSGSGKTTLVDLVLGLIEPQSGTINIDDTNLTDLDIKAWRRMIGYVPQEMFLFHDSILANISLGDPEIDVHRVKKALEMSEAWEFVSGLPQGLETVVGESGAKLSGGQRQRIALARALVRSPSLLVLDEVTTALDPETEKAICSTLRNLAANVTILTITHQKALADIADYVWHIEDGYIAE